MSLNLHCDLPDAPPRLACRRAFLPQHRQDSARGRPRPLTTIRWPCESTCAATCAGFPDEVLRVLDNIKASDFVFSDAIAQVEMPRIVDRRCALIGDAAHCPTFLSGMGSSLALQ